MRSLVLTGIALAFAAPLAAQHQHGEMNHDGMAMGPGHAMCQEMMKGGGMMGGVMSFAPAELLKQAVPLALSSDQVARLTTLRDATIKATDDAQRPAMASHMSLEKMMKESPGDTTAIRELFMVHHAAMGNMHWVEASAAFQARAILTDAQRALVK